MIKNKGGKAIIFSAPSGAGKTTLVHYLLSVMPQALEFSVSACSRAQRKGEVNGKDYYFLSVDEFKNKIANNEFIEWEQVYLNNYYGTLKSEIDRIWTNGKNVIFDVDVVGGLNLKKQFGDKALAVFVKAPSVKELENRLRSRNTETEESITRRMGKAAKEIEFENRFDKVIINENIEEAKQMAQNLIEEYLSK